MQFDTSEYAFFLVAVFALHWLLRGRARSLLLLVASDVFYGVWDWRFLALLWFSTTMDWAIARAMQARHERGAHTGGWLTASVVLNLSVLGFFKYFGFFVDSFVDLCAHLQLNVDRPTLHIVLPVGVSFYTFQSLSYTIDVHRKHLPAERSLLDFALYVAWFPQLVAGPIERATRLLPQLKAERRFDAQQASDGLVLVAWGLFKKMVIADRVALIANDAFAAKGPPTGIGVALGVVAFALQIFADFSAYSDIARGTSKLFGVELMKNFNAPYLATGPREFWQRWHISLSTWLRDYLYIPLGGNRHGTNRLMMALMITMVLGGLWHGARWTFVLWGLFHGLLLCAERGLRLDHPSQGWRRLLRILLFLPLTLLGWLLFRATSVTQAMDMLQGLWSGSWMLSEGVVDALWILALSVLPLLAMLLRVTLRTEDDPLCRAHPVTRAAFCLVVFELCLVLRVQERIEFIYFQF